MKIYDLKAASGRAFAFEVANLLMTRRSACNVARSIPGATIIKHAPFRLFKSEDVFCEFVVDGQRFQIWEPYGDNSRYWVGPVPPQWCEQLAVVREAFSRFKVFGFGGA
jgi:hypothetical protein